MYKNILYLTDLAKEHYAMCEKAVIIASKFKAKLHLLHVIELPPTLQLAQGLGFAEFDSPEQIRNDAEAVMKTLGEALTIPVNQQHVAVGSIKGQVCELVKNLNCGLLIVGRHHNPYLPAWLEHTAYDVLQNVSCDVLMF